MMTLLPLLAVLAQPPQPTPVFVETAWLAERLEDPDIVVLHVGSASSWSNGHIPGSRPLAESDFTTERDGLTMEMPDAAILESALEAAGVSDGSRIVLYATTNPPTLAARLRVTLEHFGLGDRTSILNGGLPVWTAEDRPTATESPEPARGNLALRAQPDVVADHTFVHARLQDGAASVIDARDRGFWTGERFNRRMADRAGRVAGAVNVPYSAVVDSTGRLLDRVSLEQLFSVAGVTAGKPVITYCHIGQQASMLYTVAQHLGYRARLYDGSYEDWSRRMELPVDTGSVR